MDILHLYGQSHWHDEAFVVGTRKAMLQLRAAIDSALAADSGGALTETFVNDGEGYRVVVAVVDNEQAQQLAVPYQDEVAADTSPTALRPHNLPQFVSAYLANPRATSHPKPA